MLSKNKAQEILSEAINYSPADETEVIISGGKTFSTRFTNNYISQNGAQKEYDLTVRVAFGQQVGVASCNIFDGDNLQQVIDNACLAARHSKPDHEWVPVLNEQSYQEQPEAYSKETINYTPHEKSERLAPLLEKSRERNLTSAGMLVNGDQMLTVMNSRGLFAYQAWTDASFTYTAMAENQGSAWAEYHSPHMKDLDIELLAEQAMEKSLKSQHPQTVDPGAYTVVLAPSAVVELIEFLSYLGFGGLAYEEGRAFTAGKLGQALFDSKINLYDDPACWQVLGPLFDYEGHPKTRLPLVENGVLKNVVYDRRVGKMAGKASTGHALMPPAPMGAFPTNVVLGTGDSSLEQMIENTEKGIYVTRLWYSNVVDGKQAIVTGMTRDGTFLIEDGKLTSPLRNMRYNESLIKAFSNVLELGQELRGFKGYFGKVAVPALKIKDFHFTGVSKE